MTPRKTTAAKSAPRKAAPRKTAAKKAAPRALKAVTNDVPQEGTFARLNAEAAALRGERDFTPPPPYVIEDLDPPIVIDPPLTNGQQIVIAELTETDGTIRSRNLRNLLAASCGDAWPRVWDELLRDGDDALLVAFLNDIRRHWNLTPGVGNSEVPGKRQP